MELKLNIDLGQLGYDLFDNLLVAMLQHSRKEAEMFLLNDAMYKHPDDKKMYKKVVKACDVLLEYYGGPDD